MSVDTVASPSVASVTPDTTPVSKPTETSLSVPQAMATQCKVLAYTLPPNLARIADGSLSRDQHTAADLRRFVAEVDDIMALESVVAEVNKSIKSRLKLLEPVASNMDRGISLRSPSGESFNARQLFAASRKGARDFIRDIRATIRSTIKG